MKLFIAILALLLCSPFTHAQETRPDAKSADAARRKKAVELLESLATQVTSLQSRENRARIGANIAESLWKDNENRARALFISIEDEIKSGLQDCDFNDPADLLTVKIFWKLRADTTQRIAKYDPDFALAFLTATEPQAEEIKARFTDDQREMEIQLAKQIAATNPDIALKLGRQSLSHGFSLDLVKLLRQLHRKNRDKGVTLYKEAIQKLRDTDLNESWEATEFARALVQALPPPLADESSFRELVNHLMTTALAAGCDKKRKNEEDEESFCDQIGSLVTIMEQVDPLRARKLKHLTEKYAEESSPLQAAYTELEEVVNEGTVDDILALAEKYPPIEVNVYSRAMAKAFESGDIERARKIANSYPGNPEVREELQSRVKRAESLSKLTVEEILESQKQMPAQMGRHPKQYQFLIQLATYFGSKNKSASLKLLDQAFDLVEDIKAPAEKIETRLNLATTYCALGNDRGLDIVQSQMPKLNELIDAAVKLDGFDTTYLRDGEWNMSANGEIGNVLTKLSQSAGAFASCDFDRAVSLAAQFERNEIRIMAQVKLAQVILTAH